MRTHDHTVQEQFDSQAQAYLQRPVLAQGPDLLRAKRLKASWNRLFHRPVTVLMWAAAQDT